MIRTLLAYGLILCMALPMAKAWQHTLDGHLEVHCRKDIPDHIHKAEYGCDFHKYSFSVSLHAPVLELREATPQVLFRKMAMQQAAAQQAPFRYFTLRAPPV